MVGRAIWKGVIRLPGASLPVKLYSAAVDRGVHFRLLHDEDGSPLEQHMLHPGTEAPVAYEEALRGYRAEDGRYVVLSKEELASLEPAPSRNMEVTAFVEPELVGPQWYARPYYLGPDGHEREYFALATALASEHKLGLLRWIMRKREYLGALRESDGYLVLIALRSKDEVVALPEFRSAKNRELSPKELAMAEQLIGMFEGAFDPTQFHDEYRERLLQFLETKAHGRKPKLPRARRRKPELPLTKALAESLRRARKAA